MKTALALAALLALAAAPARAQPSQSQRAAATELLVAMHVPELLDASVSSTLETQMRASPELEGVQDVLREFVRRYVSWDALREQYVEMYANTFTEDELRAMTDFYRSETGQKLARATPRLMAEGAALGERTLQAHRADLERMIAERLRRAVPPPPAPPAAPRR